jgi:hypothetical protein
MNRRAYGLLAGLIGAGVARWLLSKRRNGRTQSVTDRGTVIFANTLGHPGATLCSLFPTDRASLLEAP